MKVDVISLENKKVSDVTLPKQFAEPLRLDIIRQAVRVIQHNNRQPYGTAPFAGLRQVPNVSKRRSAYKTTFGIGQSRTPRKIMSRSGSRMNWVGAFAPQTVGGRRAHPPKASKVWSLDINKKEKRKAIRSAISATIDKDLVKKRGHKVPDAYPLVVENTIEALHTTKTVRDLFSKLSLQDELARVNKRTVRAGKGKWRGRKYKLKTGPLIVVSGDCKLQKAGRNILGIDVVAVKFLNTELLAPGSSPGRLTLWSVDAIKKMEQDKLFL